MATARNIVFTWNNYPITAEYDLKKFAKTSCKYMVFQFETAPITGMRHVQGYMEGKNSIKFATLRNLFPGIHHERRLGTAEEAREYCMKEETRDWDTEPREFGTFSPSRQGQRSDLAAGMELLKEKGLKALKEEMPGMFVRFHAGMEKLASFYDKIEPIKDFVPRKWQQQVITMLQEEANRRDVIWVVDTVGNMGKSMLAEYIVCNMNGLPLGGRNQDMAYLWDKEEHKIGIFDIPRVSAENTKHLFQFTEGLKNGMIVSTKYQVVVKKFKPAHVFFFSNEHPDKTWLSADRWKIIDLDHITKEDKEANKPWPECKDYVCPQEAALKVPEGWEVGPSTWRPVDLTDDNARDGFPEAYC